MSPKKPFSFLKAGGALLLLSLFICSCETFSGDFVSKRFAMFETVKYEDGCVATLYVDDEFVTRVEVDNCRIYLKNTVFEGEKR
jgi:hypothetical protein